MDYGAVIERGKVISPEGGGYRVESLSRPGIKTLPLQALHGEIFAPGDLVYFFMFSDGKGAIISPAG